jgi:hypothetical protein
MCRRPQIEIRTVSAEISVAILSFVLLMTAWTLIGPNGGTLASAEVPENPGRDWWASVRAVGRRGDHRPDRRTRR